MTRVQELKKKIAELAKELHSEFHWEYANWYPKFPWVLVSVLPKEQKVGNIYINVFEDAKRSNKVTLEGVVVKLWKAEHLPIKSSLEVGDHVLFPHFAGQPFDNASKEEFRLVREGFPDYTSSLDDGNIFGKLEYSSKQTEQEFWKLWHKIEDKLDKENHTNGSYKEAFKTLMQNFVIHPKESKTLSGR